MTHDEMIAVIAAHRDGRAIQVKRRSGHRWWNCDGKVKLADILSDMAGGDTFRIRPEPRRGFFPDVLYETREEAARYFPQVEIIEFVEVEK